MPTSHHEGGDGGGCDGGDHRVPLLVDVDLPVPSPPDLGGSKHPTATTHVPEGTLTSAVSTAAGNARDTRDGAASPPGLGGGLMTGAAADGIGLAAIFGDVGVDEVDDVWADGGLHDVREWDGVAAIGGHIRLERLNGDERAGGGGHWCGCVKVEEMRGIRVLGWEG